MSFGLTSASVASSTQNPVTVGDSPTVLSAIADPSVRLAIWRRTLEPTLEAAARAVCRRSLGYAGALRPFEPADEDRFRAALVAAAGPMVAPIADDLVALARAFVEVRQASVVRVRFETIADDGCARFHVDHVALRLLTTYRGTGTQWVAPPHARTAHARQTAYRGPLNTLSAGHVALFRGARSDGAGGIMHRSPPRGKNGVTRLLGVIDDPGG
ncbi:MAG: DUF1826 domain-containing protein [Maricaulaceae bacterium]